MGQKLKDTIYSDIIKFKINKNNYCDAFWIFIHTTWLKMT